MSYADIIHDLEGDKGREWFILRREAYEQAAKADAEIAALTEKLRAVEAERDEAQATIRARSAAHSQVADENGRLGAQLSALRAELERKDAALKVIAESDEWSGGLSNTSHQERARAALDAKAGGQ